MKPTHIEVAKEIYALNIIYATHLAPIILCVSLAAYFSFGNDIAIATRIFSTIILVWLVFSMQKTSEGFESHKQELWDILGLDEDN